MNWNMKKEVDRIDMDRRCSDYDCVLPLPALLEGELEFRVGGSPSSSMVHRISRRYLDELEKRSTMPVWD